MDLIKCPHCGSNIKHINAGKGNGNFQSCIKCGYFAATTKIRNNIDYDNDLGRYMFYCTNNPWGCITFKNRFIITDICVDMENVDSMIKHIIDNKNDYTSIQVSCFKDGEFIVQNLLEFL